ncbi:hypothetical protein FRB99_005295 [Tulasnella sp. 403]|nr:hypothetical protein FRB99_005295 [Tulasnella sp. 403]
MDPPKNNRKWNGFSNLRYLFVFGDSYSSVGYNTRSPDPTDENPLGVKFPGFTYCERSTANWIGFLVSDYAKSKLLVYDYAVGGSRVDGVVTQIHRSFLETVGHKDEDRVPWDESNSLFVIWVGTNDVAYADFDAPDGLTLLFEWVFKLHEAGARNFLILNVPPLPRPENEASMTSPVWLNRVRRCNEWNNMLPQFLSDFTASYPETSMFLFDAYKLFSDMFAEPTKHGFEEGAGMQFDEVMYVDHIHPTSGVHAVLAREVARFLSGGKADGVEEGAEKS